MQKIIIGKTYRHFKGNLYRVMALGKNSENMEEMVVYKSLSNNHVWIRPRKMWKEVVDDKGTLRFTLVE